MGVDAARGERGDAVALGVRRARRARARRRRCAARAARPARRARAGVEHRWRERAAGARHLGAAGLDRRRSSGGRPAAAGSARWRVGGSARRAGRGSRAAAAGGRALAIHSRPGRGTARAAPPRRPGSGRRSPARPRAVRRRAVAQLDDPALGAVVGNAPGSGVERCTSQRPAGRQRGGEGRHVLTTSRSPGWRRSGRSRELVVLEGRRARRGEQAHLVAHGGRRGRLQARGKLERERLAHAGVTAFAG